jgi:hypothetical protein
MAVRQVWAAMIEGSCMGLVVWNTAQTKGRGKTGTSYVIARTDTRWSVYVDGDVLCTTEDEAHAIARTEYLEALRHVISGRGGELSPVELAHAAVVATEMKEASDEIVLAGRLPRDELDSVNEYSRHLDVLLEVIRTEQTRRKAAGPLR